MKCCGRQKRIANAGLRFMSVVKATDASLSSGFCDLERWMISCLLEKNPRRTMSVVDNLSVEAACRDREVLVE